MPTIGPYPELGDFQWQEYGHFEVGPGIGVRRLDHPTYTGEGEDVYFFGDISLYGFDHKTLSEAVNALLRSY